MDLASYPTIICCFVQEGCGACTQYLPRFEKVANEFKACVPSVIVRADQHPELADAYWVRSTPTTLILHHGRRSPYLIDHAVSEKELRALYGTVLRGYALRGEACEL